MTKLKLTEDEADLIKAIRNDRISYPPSEELLYFIKQLLDKLLDGE